MELELIPIQLNPIQFKANGMQIDGNSFFLCSNLECCSVCLLQWFEVLDGLLGPYWKAAGLTFNCTFLLFGVVIQLIANAR
jgi:hypothetical protein